jgi:uncharacterized protein (TIGR03067 family)
MSRFLVATLVLAAVVLPLRSAPKLKDRPTPAPLVGEWRVIVVEGGNGIELVPTDRGPAYAFTAAGRVAIKDPVNGDSEWDFRAGDGPAPRPLDMDPGAGFGPGIYRVEGDTLTACFAPPGADRPPEFARPPGSNFVLLTLTRIKR